MRPATGFIRDRDSAHGVDGLVQWLTDRDTAGHNEAQLWMVRRETLSTDILSRLWTDRAWAETLTNLVIETVDGHDEPAGSENEVVRGFLVGVSAGRGVAVLGMDGTARWVARRRWTIVHPVLLAELHAWRAAAREARIEQAIPQLGRAVFLRDRSAHRDSDTVAALPAVADLPAPVDLTLPMWESGAWITADITVAADAATLSFRNADSRRLQLAAVGQVAWSETVRTARLVAQVRR